MAEPQGGEIAACTDDAGTGVRAVMPRSAFLLRCRPRLVWFWPMLFGGVIVSVTSAWVLAYVPARTLGARYDLDDYSPRHFRATTARTSEPFDLDFSSFTDRWRTGCTTRTKPNGRLRAFRLGASSERFLIRSLRSTKRPNPMFFMLGCGSLAGPVAPWDARIAPTWRQLRRLNRRGKFRPRFSVCR